jgi:hypothetical protein
MQVDMMSKPVATRSGAFQVATTINWRVRRGGLA